MGVKIDFKDVLVGNDVAACQGNVFHFVGGEITRTNLIVETSDGHRIDDILEVTISVKPDNLITAMIECVVESIENMPAISAEFKNMQLPFIEREVAKHGYKLVKADE